MIYLQGVQGTVAKYDAIVEALEAKVRKRLIGWEFIGAGWKEFMTHCFSPDGYWMYFSEGIWDGYLDVFCGVLLAFKRVRVCTTWEVECPSLAKPWKAKAGIGGLECAAESY